MFRHTEEYQLSLLWWCALFSRQSPWLPGVLIMAHYVICADIVFNRPAPVAMVTWMGQWFRGAGVSQLDAVSYAVCLLVTYFDVVVSGEAWGEVCPTCTRVCLCVCVCVCVKLSALALSAEVLTSKLRLVTYCILFLFEDSHLKLTSKISSLRFESEF